MPNIVPISDLRNYSSVLENVAVGSPVYLTKNGRGCYAIVDISEQEEYEKAKAALRLMCELEKGKRSGEENGWSKLCRRPQAFLEKNRMKYNVTYSTDAIRDLDEIWDYIANVLKNPVAAGNIVAGILDKSDLLEEQPEIGTRLFFDNTLDSGYRYVIYNNYLAFYRVSDSTVYIDRVIYGKCDYMKLLFN